MVSVSPRSIYSSVRPLQRRLSRLSALSTPNSRPDAPRAISLLPPASLISYHYFLYYQTQIIMSTRTFHSFPLLPKELRDQIWEDCVHTFEPSAQFFSFFSYEHREHELDELSGQAVGCAERFRATIAAPRSRETGEISWSRHNKSAYLIDHGLWTACWESREVIEKRYNRQGRIWGDPLKLSSVSRWPADTLAGSFQENGRLRCFTISPAADLICLKPFNYRTAPLGS
ncbi:hypothetical protein F5X97DRAFT_44605 [Nemania serpens]|nr:hypothetical protein F5X97DRAFT_44605 [Nemania serpens]